MEIDSKRNLTDTTLTLSNVTAINNTAGNRQWYASCSVASGVCIGWGNGQCGVVESRSGCELALGRGTPACGGDVCIYVVIGWQVMEVECTCAS